MIENNLFHLLTFQLITDKQLEQANLINNTGHDLYVVYKESCDKIFGNIGWTETFEEWCFVPTENVEITLSDLQQITTFIEQRWEDTKEVMS